MWGIIQTLNLTNQTLHKQITSDLLHTMLQGRNTIQRGWYNYNITDITKVTQKDLQEVCKTQDKNKTNYRLFIKKRIDKLRDNNWMLFDDVTQKKEYQKQLFKDIIIFSYEHLEKLADKWHQFQQVNQRKNTSLDVIQKDWINWFIWVMAWLWKKVTQDWATEYSRLINTMFEETARRMTNPFAHQYQNEIAGQTNAIVNWLKAYLRGKKISEKNFSISWRAKDPHSRHTKMSTQSDYRNYDNPKEAIKDSFGIRIGINNCKLRDSIMKLVVERLFKNNIWKYQLIEYKQSGNARKMNPTINILKGFQKEQPQGIKKKENEQISTLQAQWQYLNRLTYLWEKSTKSWWDFIDLKFIVQSDNKNNRPLQGEIAVLSHDELINNEIGEGNHLFYKVRRSIIEKVRKSPKRNGIIHTKNIQDIVCYNLSQTQKHYQGGKDQKMSYLDTNKQQYINRETKTYHDIKSIKIIEFNFESNTLQKNNEEITKILTNMTIDHLKNRKEFISVSKIKKWDKVYETRNHFISSTLINERLPIGKLASGVTFQIGDKEIETQQLQDDYDRLVWNPKHSPSSASPK